MGGKDTKIIVYGRENSSGTYAYFKEHVLGNADLIPACKLCQEPRLYHERSRQGSPKPLVMAGLLTPRGFTAAVKKDADSPAVEPNMENVLSGKYPISRYLYWYRRKPGGEIKKLVAWVLGHEGQKLVENVGATHFPKNKLDDRLHPAQTESTRLCIEAN
ncbi:MAG: hypothetical protein U0V70_05680 [Terriglobia bacterium]